MNFRIIGGASAAFVVACATPLLVVSEGIVTRPYVDSAGVLTFCAGETGKDIKPGMRATVAECLARLNARATVEWMQLTACIRHDLHLWEAVAILNWGYNVGTGAACSSTLMRKLNAGAPALEWCAEISKWQYTTVAGVKLILPGTPPRRVAEREMCEGRTFHRVVGGSTTTAPAWLAS